MKRIAQIIEFVMEDVNEEEGKTLKLFSKLLEINFRLLLLLGIPFLLYVLFSLGKLI